jgi:hypothetical protein
MLLEFPDNYGGSGFEPAVEYLLFVERLPIYFLTFLVPAIKIANFRSFIFL